MNTKGGKMVEREVLLAKMTRREFKDAMDAGKINAAVIPAGSNEQHLEHLPMEFDMAAATHDIDLPEMIAYTNCEPNSYF